MDDKSAVKAKGLWEDWHMRQLGEQPGRNNHRSGAAGGGVGWGAAGAGGGWGGETSPVVVFGTLEVYIRFLSAVD